MLVDEFDYRLPEELIAQHPLRDRASSRMLVVHKREGRWEDRRFSELPQFLKPGDCLVLNDSKVFPSRLFARRDAGPASIEVFLLAQLPGQKLTWEALVRPGRKVHTGELLRFDEGLSAEVLDRGEHGLRILRFDGTTDLYETLERIGHVPLPPYIQRPDSADDRERYQTIWADHKGSVAAPTAGLHFTQEIVDQCKAAGAAIARVTLHVGLGTFQPLKTDVVEDAQLHFERYRIGLDTMSAIQSADRRVAVGTTTVRTLESAFASQRLEGETNLFIYPGFRFLAVGAMLTNFHLPRSSLLMLVCAFAGQDLAMAAYRHAVEQQYRFFSYGDCMLIV